MSSDFQPIFRGKMYCKGQLSNSSDFNQNFGQIKWDKETVLEEVEERGNHSCSLVRHFKVKKKQWVNAGEALFNHLEAEGCEALKEMCELSKDEEYRKFADSIERLKDKTTPLEIAKKVKES